MARQSIGNSVYEKAIIPQSPIPRPYNRLMILYRKRKEYEKKSGLLKWP